jgi:hypothetical protein
VVRFVENSLSFDQLNISRADVPCVLENGVGKAARSTQPVTLYITVDITPPNLCNRPPCIPTEDDDSPAEEATIPGREHPLPLPHHQPVSSGNIMPHSREEMSPTTTKNTRFALDRADESMNRIIPIDRSNTWELAVGRIKWVMDTLSPIAEVRNSLLMSLAKLNSTFSFPHSQRWRTVYSWQSPRHVHFCHFPNHMLMLCSFGW